MFTSIIVALVVKYRRKIVLAWRQWRLAFYGVRSLEYRYAAHYFSLSNPERRAFYLGRAEEIEAECLEYTRQILGVYNRKE